MANEESASPLRCKDCASDLKSGARKCLECDAWQNWKRYVPASQLTLALLISLISVTSAIVPPILRHFANRSNTYVRVLGERELVEEGAPPHKTILVLVANNGKRPSIVKSAAISFEGINAATTGLEIHETSQKLVPPEKQMLFHLSADQVERTNGATNASSAPIHATVTVTVEETDVHGNLVEAAPAHRVPATVISDWMERYVPQT